MKKTTKKRQPVLWSFGYIERLGHDSIDDVMEEYFQEMEGHDLPDHIIVEGYAKMELPRIDQLADWVLCYMTEMLDDEYAHDPDLYSWDKADDEMKEAAIQFAAVVYRRYNVTLYESVCNQKVLIHSHDDYSLDSEEAR